VNHYFKFVHAADLHLDSPLIGLEAFDDAPVETIRDATREALRRLVNLCIDEQVQFLLIAGDVYDGEWKSMATGRFFADQMARLAKAEIPVYLIKGNHDAASKVTQNLVVPGVTQFDHKRAQTHRIDDIGVAIHGQSYARPDVTENLSLGYPAPVPGMFNIGMLHTCGTGGSTLHAPYAPCNLDDLVRKGYDYWALGHVHQRAVLNENPHIIFPGNIQGRHVREPAEEGKGVTIVEVAGGSIRSLKHVPLDTVRWMSLNVDVSGAISIDEVYSRVNIAARDAFDSCGECLLAARITLSGNCAASLEIHKDPETFEEGLRSSAQGAVSNLWIEEVRVRTRAETANLSVADQGSLGDLLEYVRTAGTECRMADVNARLTVLRNRIQSIAPEIVDELDLNDENLLADLLPEIEETILSMASGAVK